MQSQLLGESISTSALAGDESWRATPALASFDIKLMISTMKHFFVSFPNLDDVFFAVHANAVNQLDEKKNDWTKEWWICNEAAVMAPAEALDLILAQLKQIQLYWKNVSFNYIACLVQ